jgi:hypothetical protein
VDDVQELIIRANTAKAAKNFQARMMTMRMTIWDVLYYHGNKFNCVFEFFILTKNYLHKSK